jgi:phosphosulfolactate synthase (CoM biosynthesis protein A)
MRIVEQLAAFVTRSSYDNLTMTARQALNQFLDHSQIVQLECLRSGIWGTKSLWGQVVTGKG